MKKTILAGMIAAISTSSFAATELYKNDDTTVTFGGEVDAYLATMDIQGEKTDPDVNVWAKLQLNAEQKLSNKYTAFASFEVESGSWYDGTNNDATFDDVYVGVKTDTWGVAVGEVGDLADSSDAIEKDDITNEGNYMGGIGGHHKESSGHGIVAKAKLADFTLVADMHTESDENIDSLYGVSADYAINGLTVGAMYQAAEAEKLNDDGDRQYITDFQAFGASVSYEIAGFYAAMTYTQFEGVDGFGFFSSQELVDGQSLGLAASYSFDKARVYSTYAMADLDKLSHTGAALNDGDVTNFVIGVDYELADNILTFVEYQTGEADGEVTGDVAKQDGETVVAGVYYSF
ncbi:porin [Vibrio hippocampi]|uniref:Porin domain-containing protein n=1 Tax=Vibrio hippocampi TaxID=654686 RepID=A0ABN8DR28_9VIBR|nr:porin [Vibrio hippocampi]CAH0530181.1 hypothetical protein VHP8226_03885 [Vibrio hippocampi]